MSILHAVITAGGTSEPVDDVRVIGNLSSGRLGACLAESFAAEGVRVTLLTSGVRPTPHPLIQIVPYRSSADLRHHLDGALASHPDVVCMAAAVSDYTVEPASGKLSSDAETLTLQLTRAPKILPTLRPRCPDALLVGFKLMSSVPHTQLIDVARRQTETAQLDATVANDLSHFTDNAHPAHLVWGDAPPVAMEGNKSEVAKRLSDLLLQRIDPDRQRRRRPVIRPDVPQCIPLGPWHRLRERMDAARPPSASDAEGQDTAVVPLWIRHEDLRPVGCLQWHGKFADLWIDPDYRGLGLASSFLASMADSSLALRCTPESHAFFARRGWVDPRDPLTPEVVRAPGKLSQNPPSTLAISHAASIALWNPQTDRVLVGERLAGAARGAWAFPGGHIEAGETPMDAALAELWEEVGVRIPRPETTRWFTTYVADGARLFCIQTATIAVPSTLETRRSPEFAPHWMTVADAVAHPDLLPGPRWILQDWLGTSDARRETTE